MARDTRGNEKKNAIYPNNHKKEINRQTTYKIKKRPYLRPGSHNAEKTTI
jgi:hypothetical protein